ncbi:MAG: hypothetical protein ABI448_15420 [Bacteroidia bacterium]
MAPTFYNGFPLVYSDTGTYINSGMKGFVPNDRPALYGLFIKATSLGFSLWLVVFMQCLILSYILWLVFKLIVKNDQVKYTFILVLVFLTAFTSIGWYAGQIMPDIFTPICILSMGLLLFYKEIKSINTLVVSGIFIFSTGVHFSNIIIALLLLFTVFIFVKVKRSYFIMTFSLLVLSLLSVGIINYSIEKKFRMSKSGSVFIMGRLIDSGVLKTFLQDKCPTQDYELCACKDSLPRNSREFLWYDSSPLQKMGGWDNPSGEFSEIIFDVFKSPKHGMIFIGNSLSSSFSQLFQNEIGSGLISEWYEQKGSPPYDAIATYFPNQLNSYLISRQNKNIWRQGLNFDLINTINYLLLIGSMLFVILIFHQKTIWNNISQATKYLLIICVLGIIINAIVTATLANIYDRLQARVSWMLILSVLLVIVGNYKIIAVPIKGKINYLFK